MVSVYFYIFVYIYKEESASEFSEYVDEKSESEGEGNFELKKIFYFYKLFLGDKEVPDELVDWKSHYKKAQKKGMPKFGRNFLWN